MASVLQRPVRSNAQAVDTTIFDNLGDVACDADGALGRVVQPSLYDRLEWVRLTRFHIFPTAQLIVVRARRGDDAAWLFLRDMGSGRTCALAGWYTLRVAPIFTPGVTDAARADLLRGIVSGCRGISRIDLSPLSVAAAAMLSEAFRSLGWRAAERAGPANWTLPVAGLGMDDYWAKRPSRLRNTVRRREKTGDLTFRVLDRFDARDWSAYEEVYAGSWKPAEGSPGFLRALAMMEGEAGSLRLGLAFRGDRPVAGQFWTVADDAAIIHKLAYLETERASSPGTLLSHAMFRHVIERDRPAVIDYGNGDEPYKAEWMTERRVLRHLSLFNTRTLGGLAGAAGAIARSVRDG